MFGIQPRPVEPEEPSRCSNGMPTFKWDSVTKEGKIGSGAYSKVGLYHSTQYGKVAIKTLRERCSANRKTFVKEASLLHKLNHNNVVKFYSYSGSGPEAMMLEYVTFDFSVLSASYNFHKYSLEHLLEEMVKFNFMNCEHLHWHVVFGLVDGLAYLHSNDIAHRDLKPSNILVGNMHYSDGSKEEIIDAWKRCPIEVKLADFGESRANNIQTKTILQTKTDDLYRGSSVYMAPEILYSVYSGDSLKPMVGIEALKTMDIWSLAMTVFVMLNPNVQYPYESEFLAMALTPSVSILETTLVKLWKQGNLPQENTEYKKFRDAEWKNVKLLYDKSAIINVLQRPSIGDLLETMHNISDSLASEISDNELNLLPTGEVAIDPENVSISSPKPKQVTKKKSSKAISSNVAEPQPESVIKTKSSKAISSNVAEPQPESVIKTKSSKAISSNVAEPQPESVIKTKQSSKSTVTAKTMAGLPPLTKKQLEELKCQPIEISDNEVIVVIDSEDGTSTTGSIMSNIGRLSSEGSNPPYSDEIEYLPLNCSQMTAIADYDLNAAEYLDENGELDLSLKLPDNDATNACTFLCIMIGIEYIKAISKQNDISNLKTLTETTIEDFPSILNEVRVKDRGYAVDEALSLLQSLDLIKERYGLSNRIQAVNSTSAEKFEEIWKECISPTYHCLVLVAPPYTLLMLVNDEEVILVDTHPVPTSLGGTDNGLIVRVYNTESGRESLIQWIAKRVGLNEGINFVVEEIVSQNEAASVWSDSSDGETCCGIGYVRQLLDPSNWDQCQEELAIPHDVDGLHKYRLPCTRQTMMRVSQDGRPWGTWGTSSRKYFEGVRRTAVCKGSTMCVNQDCKVNEQQNQGHFERKGGILICKICGEVAVTQPCLARKVWEYSNKEVVVMHVGSHTCVAKLKKMTAQNLMKELKGSTVTSASSFVQHKMSSLMASNVVDWDAVENVAEEYANLKQINNAKDRVSSSANGNSFDAVCIFKKQTDQKDKYLVYKLNNRDMNNGLPSFVFKTSKSMADIGISMDKDSGAARDECYAFFDTKHDRTESMKTATLWTYDPSIKRVLLLAVMDMEEENTDNLKLFWQIWNEVLQEVACNINYHFNPIGWIVDENPANWKSLKEVFGDAAILTRVFSCEFHYKQSVVKHAGKVADKDEFKALCNQLLRVCTKEEYLKVLQTLQIICEACGLKAWLKWWDDRREHIFRVFKPFHAPNTNIAEIGHAWLAKTTGSKNLLIKACTNDVINAIKQETMLSLLPTGEVPLGRGPSTEKVNQMVRKRQMKYAKESGKRVRSAIDPENVPISNPKPKKVNKKKSSKAIASNVTEPQPESVIKANQSSKSTVTAKTIAGLPPLTKKQLKELKRQPIEVKRRHGNIKICFGCQEDLQATKEPPNDLILLKKDYRVYKKEAMWNRHMYLTNTYYDLDMACLRRKTPTANRSSIVVPDDLHLSEDHIKKLHEFGIHSRCNDC